MATSQAVNKATTGWPRRNSGSEMDTGKPTLQKANSITINRTINV